MLTAAGPKVFTYSHFQERVNEQPIHKFNDNELMRFQENVRYEFITSKIYCRLISIIRLRGYTSSQIWELVRIAAKDASRIYGDVDKVFEAELKGCNGHKLDPKGEIKSTIIYRRDINERPTMVIVVRGSKGIKDWVVNFDSEPMTTNAVPRTDNVGIPGVSLQK